ncbi:MAG: 23S rRNA (pseudouridine(1915)-N(3))-methyltransferase RlmH [Akkermansiaceae bacterium]
MRYRIVVAGKPALDYAKSAVDEYLKRLSRHGSYEWVIVKAGTPKQVSERLLEKSENCFRIALDERGNMPTTRELASNLEKLELEQGVKTVAFLIGAADGHAEALRNQSDLTLALSKMTMQHELALVVLLEQLYRVASIKARSPYHRD